MPGGTCSVRLLNPPPPPRARSISLGIPNPPLLTRGRRALFAFFSVGWVGYIDVRRVSRSDRERDWNLLGICRLDRSGEAISCADV